MVVGFIKWFRAFLWFKGSYVTEKECVRSQKRLKMSFSGLCEPWMCLRRPKDLKMDLWDPKWLKMSFWTTKNNWKWPFIYGLGLIENLQFPLKNPHQTKPKGLNINIWIPITTHSLMYFSLFTLKNKNYVCVLPLPFLFLKLLCLVCIFICLES